MPLIRSFAPASDVDAKILILGSMPGKKSLERNQYYAHPANAFWKIMCEVLDTSPALPYEEKLRMLKSSGIALWDVLASCDRATSLDSHIKQESANDFESFFRRHPDITDVFFNGSMAEQCFRKFVLKKQSLPPLKFHRLPSTSPAHAAMSYREKLQKWRVIIIS